MKKTQNMHYKLILPVVALSALLAGCHSEQASEETNQPIAVLTEQLKEGSTDAELAVSGNVEGDKTVRLGFMVAGRINFIMKEEGMTVHKGQLVASLDNTNYSIAKNLADVQVNQVTDEYNRLKSMYDKNSISESDFKKVSYTLDQAKLQRQLQAKNLADTKLNSPISGVVIKKLSEEGEMIGTGSPVIVISDINKVKVNAYIPESELHNIKIGQLANVKIASLSANYSGKVIEVGSAADPTSRAFTVKIEISNPQLLIRPGMIAEISIPTLNQRAVITVPVEAVLKDVDGQGYVYVVDQQSKKAFKRKVSLGQIINNRIEITTGLKNGEIIVTGGQNKLSDGALITVK